MGSSIVKLYTCVEADVPPELRRWHVTEEELARAKGYQDFRSIPPHTRL